VKTPRAKTVLCACRRPLKRFPGDLGFQCLRCQTNSRLFAAGITRDDPAFAVIAEMNADAMRRSRFEAITGGKPAQPQPADRIDTRLPEEAAA
jgi:hypothetical protein